VNAQIRTWRGDQALAFKGGDYTQFPKLFSTAPMQLPELSNSHPLLRSLDALVQNDGFVLTSAVEGESKYVRHHAGWSTHIRLLVRTYEPECTCPYCQECDHETWYSLMFEVEMEQDGVVPTLRGYVEVPLEEAVSTYRARIRPLPDAIPMHLYRTSPEDISGSGLRWGDTPFPAYHALLLLATVRWECGQLEESRRCYEGLLASFVSRLTHHRAAIEHRIAELRDGVRFEERSPCADWLPY
jgi:hypothetical protein